MYILGRMGWPTHPEPFPVLDAGGEGNHEEDEEDPAQHTDQAAHGSDIRIFTPYPSFIGAS